MTEGLSTDRWTALLTPERGRGVQGGMKHVSSAWCPREQRTYLVGGDYDGPVWENSYRQELWAFSLRERLAARADPNAGWELIDPYVALPGTIKPKHPDMMGWDYDAVRDGFWLSPGIFETSTINPPGETSARLSDPQYRFQSVMFFDRRTRRWAEVSQDVGQFFDGLHPVYDPVDDQIIRYDNDGGWGPMVSHFSCRTKVWTVGQGRSGPFTARIEQERLALDATGRLLYSVDPLSGHLYAYNLRLRTLADLGAVPQGRSGVQGWGFLEWIPSLQRLAHWSLTQHVQLIDPATMAVTPLPIGTDTDASLHGLLFYYDPTVHALVLQGGLEPTNPYLFALGLPGIPPVPPPTPPPVVPEPPIMPITTVRATLTYTTQTVGNPVAKYSYDLLNAAQALVARQEATIPVPSVDFAVPPPAPGYTVKCRTLDSLGVDIAPPQTSAPFDIAGVTITVIGAVTVQVL